MSREEAEHAARIDLASAVLVVSAALLAGSYIPARRATKIDPMVGLHYE